MEIPDRPNSAYFYNNVLWNTFLFIINALLTHPLVFGYFFHHNDGLNPDIRINLVATLYEYLFIDKIPGELQEGIFKRFGTIQREYNKVRDFRASVRSERNERRRRIERERIERERIERENSERQRDLRNAKRKSKRKGKKR